MIKVSEPIRVKARANIRVFLKSYLFVLITFFALPVIVVVVLFWPKHSYANGLSTTILSQTITKETKWLSRSGPYNISGIVTVPKNTSLTIEQGSVIHMLGAQFKVYGSLYLKGTTVSPINLDQDAGSTGFSIQGGKLEIEGLNLSGGSKIIDDYLGGDVTVTNSTFTSGINNYYSNPSFSIWANSKAFISNSSLENISAPYGVEVYGGSTLNVTGTSFRNVGGTASLAVYNSGQNFSNARIEESTFSNSATGIEIFGKANVDITGTQIKDNRQSGLLIYNQGRATISNSTISGNDTAIEAYNASTTVSESYIENNSSYGAYASGGTFTAPNNWWGDESGPRNTEINIQGKGNEVVGSSNIFPWLKDKLKKRSSCCSNVLFIPGLQGSRLYKKQLLSENQLWEPNRNADVKKLFLDIHGVPIDSSAYTRDIILRTNIGLGVLDRNIYKGFSDTLDNLVKDNTLQAWRAYPYDWRMSPEDVVNKGTKTSDGVVHIEDEVKKLATSSHNKKVTIIAHSYGGLVAKALVEELEKDGNAGLIERVILVGTPEDGTVEAVAGLLHGDDQELGRGYVLDAGIARSLGINMPSAYYLLPSQSMLSWLKTPAIQGVTQTSLLDISSNSSISDLASFDEFLKNFTKQRPSSKTSADLQLPAILNSELLSKTRIAESSLLGRTLRQKITANIDFINIVGTGLKTIKSISYKETTCDDANSTAPFFGTVTCGLSHNLGFTDSGDGIVLTGNMDDRWGDKILIDLGSYNAKNRTNYNHTDMISSPIITDVIKSILKDPSYFSGSNSSNSKTDYITSVPSTDHPNPSNLGPHPNPAVDIHPVIHRQAYKISVKGKVLLTATSYDKKITGLKEKKLERYSFPVFTQIPNSTFVNTDSESYLLTEETPQNISLQNADDEVGIISIDAEKIMPPANISQPYNSSVSPLFSFGDIPVTPDTHIEIENLGGTLATTSIPNLTNTSTSSTYSIATTTEPIMRIDRDGDGVFENVIIYSLNKIISSTTPAEALKKLRTVISSSTVSLRFKQRYIVRTNPIALYIKKKQNILAYSYSSKTLASLTAIVKELSRSRSRYYRGGMTRKEASLMYFIWADFTNTMKDIIKNLHY